MWQTYAILSALCAAMTTIFANLGTDDTNPNLATAIRTTVILFLTWAVAFAVCDVSQIRKISGHSLLFLVLSGAATGLSWLFYFKALKLADVSKVAPVDKLSVVFTIFLAFLLLGEHPSPKVIVGGLLILAGSFTIIL